MFQLLIITLRAEIVAIDISVHLLITTIKLIVESVSSNVTKVVGWRKVIV